MDRHTHKRKGDLHFLTFDFPLACPLNLFQISLFFNCQVWAKLGKCTCGDPSPIYYTNIYSSRWRVAAFSCLMRVEILMGINTNFWSLSFNQGGDPYMSLQIVLFLKLMFSMSRNSFLGFFSPSLQFWAPLSVDFHLFQFRSNFPIMSE